MSMDTRRGLSPAKVPSANSIDTFLRICPSSTDRSSILRIFSPHRRGNCLRISEDSKSVICSDNARAADEIYSREKLSTNRYSFQRVFSEEATNEEVYKIAIRPIVQQAMQGQNGCVLSYGQTGTGKKFTLEGPLDSSSNHGVVRRSLQDIFFYVQQLSTYHRKFQVRANMYEIFNENIIDLMVPRNTNLRVIEENGRVEISNLSSRVLTTPDDVTDLLKRAPSIRAIARMTDKASTGHTVIMITVDEMLSGGDAKLSTKSSRLIVHPQPAQISEATRQVAKIAFVVLVGSEKAHDDGRSIRSEDTQLIAKTFNALLTVMSYHSRGESNIPVRYSKLTQVLKDCLNPPSKIIFLATVSPLIGDYFETLTTLKFANKIRESHKDLPKRYDETPPRVIGESLKSIYNQGLEKSSSLQNGGVDHSLPQKVNGFGTGRTSLEKRDYRSKAGEQTLYSEGGIHHEHGDSEMMKTKVIDNLAQIQELTEERLELRKQLKASQDIIQRLERELDVFRETLHLSGAQTSQDREVLDALQLTVRRYQDDVKGLEIEKSRLIEESSQLRKKLNSYQLARDEAVMDSESSRIESERANRLLQEAQDEISRLRMNLQELTSMQDSILDVRQSAARQERIHIDLQSKYEQVFKQLQTTTSELDALTQELQRRNSEITRLDSMVQSLKEENKTEHEELLRTRSQRDQLRKQLAEAQILSESNIQKQEDYLLDIQKIRQELVSVKEMKEGLKVEVQEKTARILGLEDSNALLQQDLNRQKVLVSNLEMELLQVKKDSTIEISQLRSKYNELLEERRKLDSEHESEKYDLAAELESQQQRMQSLLDERAHMARQLQQVQSELEKREGLLRDFNSISVQYRQERESFAQFDRDHNQLSMSIISERSAKDDLSQTLMNLKVEIRNFQSEKERMITSITERRNQFMQYQQEALAIRGQIVEAKDRISGERANLVRLSQESSSLEDLVKSVQYLRDSFSELKQQMSEADRRDNEKKKLIEEFRVQFAQKEDVLISLLREKEELSNLMNRQLDEWQKEVSRLNDQISTQDSSISQLRSSLSSANNEKLQLENELQALQIEYSNIKAAARDLETLCSSTKLDLDRIHTELQSKADELQRALLTLADKNRIIQQYERQSKQYEERIDQLNVDVQSRSSDIENIRSLYASSQRQLQDARRAIEESNQNYQKQVSSYEDTIMMKESETLQFRSMKEHADHEITKQIRLLEAAQADLSVLKQKTDDLGRQLFEKNTEVIRLQGELSSKTRENQRLSTSLEEKQREFDAFTSRFDHIQSSFSQIKEDYSRCQVSLKQTQTILDDERRTVMTLRTELGDLQARFLEVQGATKDRDRLIMENTSLRNDIQRLTEEKANIAQVASMQKQSVEKQTKEYSMTRASLDELSQEVLELRASRNLLERSLADQVASSSRATVEIDRLNDMLSAQEATVLQLKQEKQLLGQQQQSSAARISDVESKLSELQSRYEDARRTGQLYQRDCDILRQELSGAQQMIFLKDKELQSAADMVQSLTQELNDNKTDVRTLKSREEALQIALNQQGTVSQAQEFMKRTIEDLREEVSSLKTERERLRARILEDEAKINNQVTLVASLEERIENLQRDSEATISRLKGEAQSERNGLGNLLTERDQVIEQCQTKIRELQKSVKFNEDQKRILETQLSDRSQIIDRLAFVSSSLDDVRLDKERFERNWNQEKQNVVALTADLDRLTESQVALEEACSRFSQEINQLTEQRDGYHLQMVQKEAALRLQEQKLNSLQEELNKANQVIQIQEHDFGEAKKLSEQNAHVLEDFKERYEIIVQEVELFRKRTQELETRLAERVQQIAEKDQELRALRNDVFDLRENLELKSQEITFVSQGKQDFQDKVSSYSKSLSELRRELGKTADERERLRQEVVTKQTELDEVALELESLRSEHRQLRIQLSQVVEESKMHREMSQNVHKALEENNKAIQETRAAHQTLEDVYETSQADLTMLKSQLSDVQQLYGESERSLRTLQANFNIQNEEKIQLVQHLKDKESELTAASKKVESQNRQIMALESKLTTCEAKLQDAFARYQDQRSVTDAERQDKTSLLGKFQDLQGKIDSLSHENSLLQEQIRNKESELQMQASLFKSSQVSLERFEAELKAKGDEIVELKRKVIDMQASLSITSTNKEHMEQENERLTADNLKCQTELAKLRADIRSSTQVREELAKEVDVQKAQIGILSRGKEDAINETKKSRSELQSLRLEHEELLADIRIVKDQKMRAEKNVEELKKQLLEAKSENATLHDLVFQVQQGNQQAETMRVEIMKSKADLESRLQKEHSHSTSLEQELVVLTTKYEMLLRNQQDTQRMLAEREREVQALQMEHQKQQKLLLDAEMELNATKGQTEFVNSELAKTIRRFEGAY